jgi:hypothetical protein
MGLRNFKLSTPVPSEIMIKHTGLRVQGACCPWNDVGDDKGAQKGYTDVNYQHQSLPK